MDIKIDNNALKTFLFTLLSCRCPVSRETEDRLFDLYFACRDNESVNYGLFLKAAENSGIKTPVHNLFDFCSLGKDDPYNFTITHNDVIRFSSTHYHYSIIKKSINPEFIDDPAVYLLSHVTVPAVPEKHGEKINALYTVNDREISFLNLVFPPELTFEEGAFFGIHLGTVITKLSMEQVKMIEKHLSIIEEYPAVTEKVAEVDFTRFQKFGDYRSHVLERIDRHF